MALNSEQEVERLKKLLKEEKSEADSVIAKLTEQVKHFTNSDLKTEPST